MEHEIHLISNSEFEFLRNFSRHKVSPVLSTPFLNLLPYSYDIYKHVKETPPVSSQCQTPKYAVCEHDAREVTLFFMSQLSEFHESGKVKETPASLRRLTLISTVNQ